jgi:hypothetical protein
MSPPTLQLTHEGHCYLDIERVLLLCDSMTNTGTGQTQIKFLTHCMRLNLTKYFAHRVTLSPPLPGQKLGNISLSTEHLFSVPGYANTMKFTTSFDGHARGICVLHNERDGTEFYGFTIDASSMDKPCSGIVGWHGKSWFAFLTICVSYLFSSSFRLLLVFHGYALHYFYTSVLRSGLHIKFLLSFGDFMSF